MQDIIRIIKPLENSDVLIDGVSEIVKYEIKKTGGGFLGIFFGTIGASVLANMLAGKGVVRAEQVVVRAGRR